MIENFSYDFHEFDSLIKLPNNSKKNRRENKYNITSIG